ncbi:MAG TPA: hypothetical protein VFV35_07900, partial [Acidimicrobiales bacterium]|nr:hypothetical protein [Acidimicrobiales bacterium]
MHRLRRAWRRRFVGALLALSLPLQLALPPARALDDSLYERQWGLAAIGAKAAWDRGLLGAGVEIAIVDTGVHVRHQDLDTNVRTGLNL